MVALAHELEIPWWPQNDIHYAKREQADATISCSASVPARPSTQPNRMRMDRSFLLHARSPQEMWELYKELPEALEEYGQDRRTV
jgi:DNA polymerase III alpha subunit